MVIEMHRTPNLPKPFSRVKELSKQLPFLEERSPQWTAGKAALYLDPRGDAGFAIGIWPEMAAILGDYAAEEFDVQRGTTDKIHERKGVYYVRGDTAAAVENSFERVCRIFAVKLAEINKREVIQLSFGAVCPRYNSQGVAEGSHEYQSTRTSYGGDCGNVTEISFSCQRGWRAGNDFYYLSETGHKVKTYGRNGFEIDFKQETWDELVAIRDTLTRAAVALGKIVQGGPAEGISARLAAMRGTPLLAPPEPKGEYGYTAVLSPGADGEYRVPTVIRRKRP